MSTSLKIAAAALLALLASSFAASPAQAQHRTNRWTGIIRDVVDVIADEIEDAEMDHDDDSSFWSRDRRYNQNWGRSNAKRIPAQLVGTWLQLTQSGLFDIPVEYSFSPSGAATKVSIRKRGNKQVSDLGRVTWDQGTLTMAGKQYSVQFRGRFLYLTSDEGFEIKLVRVE